VLIPLLADSDPYIRKRAELAIDHLVPRARRDSAWNIIVAHLGHEDPKIREAVKQIIRFVGTRALYYLHSELHLISPPDPFGDVYVSEEMVQVLKEKTEKTANPGLVLLSLVDADHDLEVRLAALRTLRHVRDMRGSLSDESSSVKQVMKKAMGDVSVMVRREAARFLLADATASSRDLLMQYRDDEDACVRHSAVRALGHVEGGLERGQFPEFGIGGGPLNYSDGVSRLQWTPIGGLVPATGHDTPKQVTEVLQGIFDEMTHRGVTNERVKLLVEATNDPELMVRYEAAIGLSRTEHPDAIEPVLGVLCELLEPKPNV
jgi:HEAT repeat protein